MAFAMAVALHLVALYFLTARQVDIHLASEQQPGATTISVSLVAAPPVPMAAPVAQTVAAVPPRAEPQRHAKATKVLATHRDSKATTAQQARAPQTVPTSPAPVTKQVMPPVSSPAALPSALSTAQAAAAHPDDGKLMSLPKVIGASSLNQLGCRIPRPTYPARARRLGESGVVRLRIRIAVDGHLADVQVVQSSGFPDLDTEAVHAVSAGSCEPYRENGVATAVTAEQPVAFDLDP
ncbi:energy transducer TonB [Paraburkholderia xenovorans]|uniref:Protein TonB n=1 Tax=Paraburkholderia xenovorans (strain LB400) TaxID=266265 RepID=Q13G68_PARXL|nr:energy transducer TonB [Paraburkholderia xenovorans]ABE36921.1 outer membrane transport energization protein TonB [Paraburkholderia xenovorans LB400]